MQNVVLLISCDATKDYMNELRNSVGFPIVDVSSVRSALKVLRERAFSLVVRDTRLAEDGNSDLLVRAAGLSRVLDVNLSFTAIPVLVRRIHSTISRSQAEQFHARNAAIAHLQGELRDCVTGLLLESQLALGEVDASKHPRLVSIVQNAKRLSTRLKLEAEVA